MGFLKDIMYKRVIKEAFIRLDTCSHRETKRRIGQVVLAI
jgi:hypothetical protein